jgi:hypothetical protein
MPMITMSLERSRASTSARASAITFSTRARWLLEK